MGAKTLSNAGLCWQLGAVEKIALYGRSLLTGEEQAQVDRGSDSHIFLRVALVWEKRLCLRGRGLGGPRGQAVACLHWSKSFLDFRAKMMAAGS